MDPRGFAISLEQQHHLARLPPEQKNAYLLHIRAKQKRTPQPSISLQNIQYNGMSNVSPPLATIQEQPQPQKRRRGGGPRKCGNPSCDRIVTKRNFCYKCQKRKERGLPMGPLLPSVSHVLQNSAQPNEIQQLPPLVNHNLGIGSPTTKTLHSVQIESNKNMNIDQPQPQEHTDAKMEQLHSYLLNLAGSEEKANELVQDYLKQRGPTQLMPRGNFAQHTQAPDQSFTRFY